MLQAISITPEIKVEQTRKELESLKELK